MLFLICFVIKPGDYRIILSWKSESFNMVYVYISFIQRFDIQFVGLIAGDVLLD